MANIDKIQLPNGSVYDIEDKVSGYVPVHYIGIYYDNENEKYDFVNCTYEQYMEWRTNDIIILVFEDTQYYLDNADRFSRFTSQIGDSFTIVTVGLVYVISYSGGTYIRRSIDESIPVSEVNEAVVGDSVGTESTNLPTSKAVVEYVERRFSELIYDESMEDIP